MIEQIKNAPIQAMKNRKLLEQNKQCGCYSCLAVFETNLVQKWTDQSQTALCPFCECDSVIIETDKSVLEAAKNYWFKAV